MNLAASGFAQKMPE